MREIVTVKITGTVSTPVREGETKEDARKRLLTGVLEGEIAANNAGDPRFHISLEDDSAEHLK